MAIKDIWSDKPAWRELYGSARGGNTANIETLDALDHELESAERTHEYDGTLSINEIRRLVTHRELLADARHFLERAERSLAIIAGEVPPVIEVNREITDAEQAQFRAQWMAEHPAIARSIADAEDALTVHLPEGMHAKFDHRSRTYASDAPHDGPDHLDPPFIPEDAWLAALESDPRWWQWRRRRTIRRDARVISPRSAK